MNAMLNNGLKVVACGAAAMAITLAMSLSFVESTASVRNTAEVSNDNYVPASWTAKLAMQPGHTFGQPQPAVLVD
jgi:hypothetical protein